MELAILKGIVIIMALSTFVNLIFTKLKVPTILGYLLTGIIAGPYFVSKRNVYLLGYQNQFALVFYAYSVGKQP